MASHLVRILVITASLILCMLYPYFPGSYDRLSVPLSWMVQAFGAVGLLLVPIGLLWLLQELRRRRRVSPERSGMNGEYGFVVASLITGTIVAIVVSLVGLGTAGLSLGLFTILLWMNVVFAVRARFRRVEPRGSDGVSPVPAYLIFIPTALFISQLVLAAPMTDFSRQRAITAAERLVAEIEGFRARQGHYPASLLAVHPDYETSVVGIEKFHYAPNGDSYDLVFEQPRFIFDRIGTREFVAFNNRNEHLVLSHAGWVLDWSPEQLRQSPGWYAVQDAKRANWKSFLFD